MKRWIMAACLLGILLITPGSAWWFDHFDSDTSAHYDGPLPLSTYWNFNSAASMLQEKQVDCVSIYYKDEKLKGGNYTWNWSINTLFDNTFLHFYFGAEVNSNKWPTCNLDTTGTSYFAYTHFGNGAWRLYKNVGGVQTLLDTNPPGFAWMEDTTANYTVTVNWTEAGDITAKIIKSTDGSSYSLHAVDTDISAGYMGFGDRYWEGIINLDYIDAWNATAGPGPTPTPTPTSTPAPTPPFTLLPEPENGLYIAGEQVQPGIISGIFLVLDQNPFLLIAAILLIYVLMTRK